MLHPLQKHQNYQELVEGKIENQIMRDFSITSIRQDEILEEQDKEVQRQEAEYRKNDFEIKTYTPGMIITDYSLEEFKKNNLKVLAGNFLPNLLGLIFLAWAFKFAAMANLNQGIITTLSSLSGVYTMVWFYFKFNEIISFAQMAGMLLMLVSVILLALEGTIGNKGKV